MPKGREYEVDRKVLVKTTGSSLTIEAKIVHTTHDSSQVSSERVLREIVLDHDGRGMEQETAFVFRIRGEPGWFEKNATGEAANTRYSIELIE